MDGIETTQRIREIGTDYAKDIPIIALTANAIVGNEEMFLSKGFQDFLSKPINVHRLDKTIKRWLQDARQESTERKSDVSIKAHDVQGADDQPSVKGLSKMSVAGLDINNGIDLFGGDEGMYLNILRSYAVNTRPLLDSMEGVSGGNLSDYAIKVHSVKGSSRNIVANEVGDFAEALEHASKKGDLDFVKTYNPAFLDLARKLLNDLDKMLSTFNTESPKPSKDKPDGELLSRLRAACDTYDIDGAETAMAELENYHYESDDGLVAWLKENIGTMNFSEIAEKLSNMDN
jgi:hypothetical protein